MSAYISPHVFERLLAAPGDTVGLILYARELDRLGWLPGGVTLTGLYPFIGALAVEVEKDRVEDLACLSAIRYITSKVQARVDMDIACRVMNTASPHMAGSKGRGVTLAVIDTGLYPHFDFLHPKVRLKHFVDMVGGRAEAYDDNGHGTAVTSCAAGSGYLSGGQYRGVAPEADIVMVKCMDETGVASAENVLAGMQWISDNRRKYDIKVCCMSFGAADLGFRDPFRVGATALWNSGIAVVAAAGNAGDAASSVKSPGTAGRIITVGALDDRRTAAFADDEIASFSGRGPVAGLHKPDVVAPGVGIHVAGVLPRCQAFYTVMSGTSISTGFVAGCCCLLAERYPGITPDEMKTYLMKNAREVLGEPDAEGRGAVLL